MKAAALRKATFALTVGMICGLGFGAPVQGALVRDESVPIRVASKNFTESYVLAEIAAQVLESAGFAVERRFGLGGTLICYQALVNDEIDLYIEYTGTLSQAILELPIDTSRTDLNLALMSQGLELLPTLGFNNTYAMAVRRGVAERLKLKTIGDLQGHPELNVVVSHEFLERSDGWPGLSAAYFRPAYMVNWCSVLMLSQPCGNTSRFSFITTPLCAIVIS